MARMHWFTLGRSREAELVCWGELVSQGSVPVWQVSGMGPMY